MRVEPEENLLWDDKSLFEDDESCNKSDKIHNNGYKIKYIPFLFKQIG